MKLTRVATLAQLITTHTTKPSIHPYLDSYDIITVGWTDRNTIRQSADSHIETRAKTDAVFVYYTKKQLALVEPSLLMKDRMGVSVSHLVLH